MLKRLLLCIILVGSPHIAVAQSVQDSIVSQLRAQGFSDITLKRTFLRRIRVIAVRDDLRRELVFNPSTGEILRDYWVELAEPDDNKNDDGASRPRIFNPGNGGNAVAIRGNDTASDDDGDDQDDDPDDDDQDDDDQDDDDDDQDDDGDEEDDDG